MATVPKTSITLLSALASGTGNARWTEFVRQYEGLMRAFLQERYPSVEPDDILQETFLALTKALPDYRYTPDEHHYFHDYLIGILKHKAADVLERRVRENEKRRGFFGERDCHIGSSKAGAWQRTIMNAALDQLMADETISARNREIFRHVALLHEAPEDVARQFGLTRNNVDVIKNRLLARLTALVDAMRDD